MATFRACINDHDSMSKAMTCAINIITYTIIQHNLCHFSLALSNKIKEFQNIYIECIMMPISRKIQLEKGKKTKGCNPIFSICLTT